MPKATVTEPTFYPALKDVIKKASEFGWNVKTDNIDWEAYKNKGNLTHHNQRSKALFC